MHRESPTLAEVGTYVWSANPSVELVLARVEHPAEEDVSFVIALVVLEEVASKVEEDEVVVLDVVVEALVVTTSDVVIEVDVVVENEDEEELRIGLTVE